MNEITGKIGWSGDGWARDVYSNKVDGSDSGGLWKVGEGDSDENYAIDLGYILSVNEGETGQRFEVWSGEGRTFNSAHRGVQYGCAPTWNGAVELLLAMDRCESCGAIRMPFDSCPRGCVNEGSTLRAELATLQKRVFRLVQDKGDLQAELDLTEQALSHLRAKVNEALPFIETACTELRKAVGK